MRSCIVTCKGRRKNNICTDYKHIHINQSLSQQTHQHLWWVQTHSHQPVPHSTFNKHTSQYLIQQTHQHLYWLQTHSHQPVPHTTNTPAHALSTNAFTSTSPSLNKHTSICSEYKLIHINQSFSQQPHQHLYCVQTHSHQPVSHWTNTPTPVLSTNTFTSTCPSFNKLTRLPHSPYSQTLLLFCWLVLQNVHSVRLTGGTKHTPHQPDCTDNSYKICTPTSYLYWLSYENTHSTKLPLMKHNAHPTKYTSHQVTIPTWLWKCVPHQIT